MLSNINQDIRPNAQSPRILHKPEQDDNLTARQDSQSPLSSWQLHPRLKPNLRLTLFPFTNTSNESVRSGRGFLHLKSPRSLPSDTFKLLRLPPTNAATATGLPKIGGNISHKSSKHRFPHFTTVTGEPKTDEYETSRYQYNSSPGSFDLLSVKVSLG